MLWHLKAYLGSMTLFRAVWHAAVTLRICRFSASTHLNCISKLFMLSIPKDFRGRGVYEALGAGQEILIGDIAFKSNFAYMNIETGIVE